MASSVIRGFLPVLIMLITTFSVFSGCQTTSGSSAVTLGNEYAKQGLLREAMDQYRKALAVEPGNAAALRNLGIMQVKTGDYPNAIRSLEKAAERYPSDFDANYYLGEACRAEGRYGDAIYRYQQSLRARPADPRALKALAWSFYKIRYYAEALTNGRKLQEIDPKDPQAAVIVARTMIKLRRFDEALQTVQLAARGSDRTALPFLRSVEGDVFLETGNHARAGDAYAAALREAPLTASALYGMARVSRHKGQMDKASDFLEKAIRVRPEMAEAHFMLGEVLEDKNPQQAKKHFEIFMKLASTDPDLLPQLEQSREKLRVRK
ncbi:MAG: hypothetical protein RIQ81_1761 [Pseudomonadota bacterium]|jgi:tetratricopeptide (TPR) repeat protein